MSAQKVKAFGSFREWDCRYQKRIKLSVMILSRFYNFVKFRWQETINREKTILSFFIAYFDDMTTFYNSQSKFFDQFLPKQKKKTTPSLPCYLEFKQQLKESMMLRKKDKVDIRNKFLKEIFTKMKNEFKSPDLLMTNQNEEDIKTRNTTMTMTSRTQSLNDKPKRSKTTLAQATRVPENQYELPREIPKLMRLSTSLKKSLIKNLSDLPDTLKKFIANYEKSMKYLKQKKIPAIDSFFYLRSYSTQVKKIRSQILELSRVLTWTMKNLSHREIYGVKIISKYFNQFVSFVKKNFGSKESKGFVTSNKFLGDLEKSGRFRAEILASYKIERILTTEQIEHLGLSSGILDQHLMVKNNFIIFFLKEIGKYFFHNIETEEVERFFLKSINHARVKKSKRKKSLKQCDIFITLDYHICSKFR